MLSSNVIRSKMVGENLENELSRNNSASLTRTLRNNRVNTIYRARSLLVPRLEEIEGPADRKNLNI